MLTEIEKRNKLVEENINLVYNVVDTMLKSKKISKNVVYDYEDLVQNGVIGLIRAAEKYDEEKGFAFSSYAYTCIRNAIIDGYLFAKKRLTDYSLLQPYEDVADNLIDVKESEKFDDVENKVTLQNITDRILKKNKGKDRRRVRRIKEGLEIVTLEYDGYLNVEIAEMLNMRPEEVSKAKKVFKGRLSEEYTLQQMN